MYKLWLTIFVSSQLFAATPQLLPASKLVGMTRGPCTFVHVWANWCNICVAELPRLVKALSALKDVTPVVVDISSPYIQQNYSQRFIASLEPPFTTYLKPKGPDDDYMAAVEKKWNRALPFSALFRFGKKKKTWTGPPDIDSLPRDIAALCK